MERLRSDYGINHTNTNTNRKVDLHTNLVTKFLDEKKMRILHCPTQLNLGEADKASNFKARVVENLTVPSGRIDNGQFDQTLELFYIRFFGQFLRFQYAGLQRKKVGVHRCFFHFTFIIPWICSHLWSSMTSRFQPPEFAAKSFSSLCFFKPSMMFSGPKFPKIQYETNMMTCNMKVHLPKCNNVIHSTSVFSVGRSGSPG